MTDANNQLPLEPNACGGPDLTAVHFASPWTVQELDVCFVVIDNDGRKLAFIYHQDEPGRRAAAAKLPTKEQALPDVLRKEWRAALATSYLYTTGTVAQAFIETKGQG